MMEVVHGLKNVPQSFKGGAIAIGFFDGVHWGHRAIFDRLLDVSRNAGISGIAFTFDRHPAELLAPEAAPPYITTLPQRIELIREAGVERILIAEFEPDLALLTPHEFLRKIVSQLLSAKYVVVGSNFRFGRNREGDIRYLSSVATEFGFELSVVPSVIIDGAPVSSTRIRLIISRGDVELASKLLGRWFVLRGTVVPGDRIGRTIGFPTANIQTEPRQLIPAHGVYTVQTRIDGSVYNGLCYIGRRPTFRDTRETVEVHVMGYSGDLYGHVLDVAFLRRLRGEMVFKSADELAEQIRKDMQRAMSELK
ncbi:MAG: bifunctional riboflavin kinase/FAD synthetase [Armatimonadota bacterium]|nr:bifunctional riboflavin kinase/FAD synthetase [Armatimonadota bacterium]